MGNKIKRHFFKELFFKKDITILLKKYQIFETQLNLWAIKWIIKSDCKCKYCNKKIKEKDFAISSSYWNSFWEGCHKDCKEQGDKKEEVECQRIDRNCNECKSFDRKGFDNHLKDTQGEKLFEKVGCYFGNCKKFKKKVTASRVICQNNKCFIHRLDYMKNKKGEEKLI